MKIISLPCYIVRTNIDWLKLPAGRAFSSLPSPTEYLNERMESEPILRARVERIQKEFEIYEYFSDFVPKLFRDKHWIALLRCGAVVERVNYWNFMALNEYKEARDLEKKLQSKQALQSWLNEQHQLYNSGGMGYGPGAYSLMYNPLDKSYITKRARLIELTKKTALQMQLGDLPHILFDCQFFPQMSQRDSNRTSRSAAHAYYRNMISVRPFPISFINVSIHDSVTKHFFLNEVSYVSEYRNVTLQPDLYTNDPYNCPYETDPQKQVIYISRHAKEFLDGPLIHKAYVIPLTFDRQQMTYGAIKKGNYKALNLPLRKYIKWKSGPYFLSWVVVFNILNEVACNGGDWEYALKKYVPKRNTRTIDERKEVMGLDRYMMQIQRRNDKNRITDLIIEALGDSPNFS